LHVKTSTPNVMVYGELGRYPIDIDIKVRVISYWSKLILGNQSKSCILNVCGMSYIWNMQNGISDKWLKLVAKNYLVDQFKQTWTSMIKNSPKGDNYKLFSMI